MKKYYRACYLIAVIAIIAELAIFTFFTHNIHDLVAFTASKACITFILLIIIIIATAICFFQTVQNKRNTTAHLLISTGYFIGWLFFAIKKINYYSSLVDEQFLSNEANLYLQVLIWSNMFWGIVLISLSIISIVRNRKNN